MLLGGDYYLLGVDRNRDEYLISKLYSAQITQHAPLYENFYRAHTELQAELGDVNIIKRPINIKDIKDISFEELQELIREGDCE